MLPVTKMRQNTQVKKWEHQRFLLVASSVCVRACVKEETVGGTSFSNIRMVELALVALASANLSSQTNYCKTTNFSGYFIWRF